MICLELMFRFVLLFRFLLVWKWPNLNIFSLNILALLFVFFSLKTDTISNYWLCLKAFIFDSDLVDQFYNFFILIVLDTDNVQNFVFFLYL